MISLSKVNWECKFATKGKKMRENERKKEELQNNQQVQMLQNCFEAKQKR